LKCFREEKLIFAFPDFITATLDKDFIELPQFDLARSFTDTSHKIPLIFILSTGADPTSYPCYPPLCISSFPSFDSFSLLFCAMLLKMEEEIGCTLFRWDKAKDPLLQSSYHVRPNRVIGFCFKIATWYKE
jgi:hypothetical protein